MCGIAVYLDATGQSSRDALATAAVRMADRMRHRGPDDAGVWSDERAGVALSHRRLTIVDLSPEGHQPMASADGRYVISFNGEIYNHLDLRDDLLRRGHVFRGHSDTEVLLSAVSEWGLDEALARFNGMFAFALWDGRARVLHLVRDRLGEKPLYYAWLGQTFVAASELKALRALPEFHTEISRGALSLYMRHGYVPAPYSIYERVFKLPPATVLSVSARAQGAAEPRKYWTVQHVVQEGVRDPYLGSPRDAADELEQAMRAAVRLRMQADVPLGAFLSGGIDSSTIVALMQAQTSQPVKTFSIGFTEPGFNEAEAAKAVAAHLGTDHTELYVTPREAMAVIPLLPSLYDEPFADSSQIPTYLVSRLARSKVTVSLSGDGGDELFGGYGRYLVARSLWGYVGWMPRRTRKSLAAMIAKVPRRFETIALRALSIFVPRRVHMRTRPGRLSRVAEVLSFDEVEALYTSLVSAWSEPQAVVPRAAEPPSPLALAQACQIERPLVERMMFWDTVSYLPDDILVKVDRASMGVSLEARVPMLDHHVVALAWRMPQALKVRGGVAKWLLREVLHRYVPPRLVERPKQGFAVPLAEWLRGPLREWAQALLAEDRLRKEGVFDPTAIRNALTAHLAGTRSMAEHLWAVLMFQAWVDACATEARQTQTRRLSGSAAEMSG